ncbi:MAG: 4Fe-4S dicluster domain-containing protein [Nitrospiraceae bacterium]|nr:4Fe-4S dicluster domain-containing protein [Nitrospiraceae bacterium]
MPWINAERCNGCGLCVRACPVYAVRLEATATTPRAFIDRSACVLCDACRDVCPERAVRSDREQVPEAVAANMAMAYDYVSRYETFVEQKGQLARTLQHFRVRLAVAERTIRQLEALGDRPVPELRALLEEDASTSHSRAN